MNNILQMALDNGQCEIRYKGIIEIYPQKFMNTFVLQKLLQELQKTHDLVNTGFSLRAFEK